MASVVPAWSAAAADVAARHAIPFLEANAETVPIATRVDQPTEIGADRLVNAFAAGRLYGTPAIVVDFGTATTLDVVAADGAYIGRRHRGRASARPRRPGARDTPQLPRIELAAPDRVIGRDTVAAMRSGAVIGHIGLANELIHRTRAELAATSPAGRADLRHPDGWPLQRALGREIRGIDASRPACSRSAGWCCSTRRSSRAPRHPHRAPERFREGRRHEHGAGGSGPRPLEGRLVLLGVTGSIAAYKAAELARAAGRRGRRRPGR